MLQIAQGTSPLNALLPKQTMSLYMAPAFFFGLLARCIHGGPTPAALAEGGAGEARAGGEPFSFLLFVIRVAKLGVVVIATFALHWAPFCAYAAEEGCVAGLGQGTLDSWSLMCGA